MYWNISSVSDYNLYYTSIRIARESSAGLGRQFHSRLNFWLKSKEYTIFLLKYHICSERKYNGFHNLQGPSYRW